MNYIYEDNRIYAKDEDGSLLAEVTFPEEKADIVNIDHVYVNNKLRGRGIASEIMLETYNYLKPKNKKVIATCPYAVSWFKKHPEYQGILINLDFEE
ncbi:MAG: GNAT family N-acetyltransferase [Bacillota bacterium]